MTKKDIDARYYKKNKQKIIARNASYVERNRERVRLRKQRWYQNRVLALSHPSLTNKQQLRLRAWLHPSEHQPGRMVDVDEVWFSKNRIKEANGNEHSLANSTLLRFTGLLDKSGKEIWEGDVVRYSYKHVLPEANQGDYIGQVVFEERQFDDEGTHNHHVGFIMKHYDSKVAHEWWYSDIPTVTDIEVIGNIYENPNLLGDKESGEKV